MASESLRSSFVSSTLAHGGEAFVKHPPAKVCQGVRTVDGCMEVGLGPEGYDCSGLVIASLTQTLRLSGHEWAREVRHPRQLRSLARDGISGVPGDVLTVWWTAPGDPGEDGPRVYHHAGVLTDRNKICDAIGHYGVVNRGIPDYYEDAYTVPFDSLVEVALATEQATLVD